MTSNKETRTFLDFEVDAQPLYGVMLECGLDMISPILLGAPAPGEVVKAIARLLGKEPGDAPGGRVSVYICAECGDLGCGAVTVELIVVDDHVVWSDWGHQTNYDDTVDRNRLPALGTLTFNRKHYEAVLEQAVNLVTAAKR